MRCPSKITEIQGSYQTTSKQPASQTLTLRSWLAHFLKSQTAQAAVADIKTSTSDEVQGS
jgi:hypothetical protein